ncbi:hypothetical protein GGI55_003544 [Rhizobium leguminosarum]|nr:hypothetical protein [Rhizobium leguminosarum]MBB4418604.1 hypothetical protein [Rhizobium leguminosarum]MBB4542949.1 hypothetical protein [Rhizobium leguminosarum]MBB5680573.1 hypothetical protein [Rhizobium leguminosarum]MBB6266240.1 hypothetical protein [Rhizobium leguminosarum]
MRSRSRASPDTLPFRREAIGKVHLWAMLPRVAGLACPETIDLIVMQNGRVLRDPENPHHVFLGDNVFEPRTRVVSIGTARNSTSAALSRFG